MAVVVLVLFFAVVLTVTGSLVAMLVKDKPLYGVYGLCVLLGPGTVLGFIYVTLG